MLWNRVEVEVRLVVLAWGRRSERSPGASLSPCCSGGRGGEFSRAFQSGSEVVANSGEQEQIEPWFSHNTQPRKAQAFWLVRLFLMGLRPKFDNLYSVHNSNFFSREST